MNDEILIEKIEEPKLRGGSVLKYNRKPKHVKKGSVILRELADKRLDEKLKRNKYRLLYKKMFKNADVGKKKAYIYSKLINDDCKSGLDDNDFKKDIYKPSTFWKKFHIALKNLIGKVFRKGIIVKISWK